MRLATSFASVLDDDAYVMLCKCCSSHAERVKSAARACSIESTQFNGNAGIDLDEMPHLKAWMQRIESRPAVQKGLDIPEENIHKQIAKDPKKKQELIEEAKKMMVSLK